MKLSEKIRVPLQEPVDHPLRRFGNSIVVLRQVIPSETLTASDAVKDLAPAGDAGKEATVPKKKAKRSNADKGVVIISDNPSGPPLDDVSFLLVLL